MYIGAREKNRLCSNRNIQTCYGIEHTRIEYGTKDLSLRSPSPARLVLAHLNLLCPSAMYPLYINTYQQESLCWLGIAW